MTEQRKNLKKYIIPAMLGNLGFFVLTIVDGMFVGNGVGEDALGAVSLAMPFITLVWAVGNLFDIGGAAVAAVCLGRSDSVGANRAFMHALSANFVFSSLLMALGMLFPREIALLLGANDTYLEMVTEYIFCFSIFILPAGIGPCLSVFARNDGHPQYSLMFAMTCTCTNIIGDWLMVYPLQMGVKGAALATGASYLFATLVVSTYYIRKKGMLRICRFKPNLRLYGKISINGIPELISQFATTITVFSMNNMLIRHLGNAAVNAYSIITYASSLFASLMWGLSSGLQPLFGVSYGAHDSKSLKFYFRSGLIIAFTGGIAIFALTFVIGKPLCLFYGADASYIPLVCSNLPKYCLNYVFAAACAVVAVYLFSTERTRHAIAVNICRSLVFNLICINLLPLVFGHDFIWYTLSVAEALSLLVAMLLRTVSERHRLRGGL